MKIILKAPKKIGNRLFPKGEHMVPDHFASNMGFKQLVAAGVAQIVPRDNAAQKVQMSRDLKALQKAKLARKARMASKSAQAASSAPSHLSSAAVAVQPLPTPAKPVSAGAAAKASEPAAPASAPGKGK